MIDARQFNRPMLWMIALLAAGCSTVATRPDYDVAESRRLLEPLTARHLEVDGGLTQPVSFDDDRLPDGLEVIVRARDAQGEPAKLAGHVVLELHSYRQASADPKAEPLQNWTLDLHTAEDQERYWNRATRRYEFPVHVNPTSLPKAGKFVMLVRCTNPWNEHFEDQAVIDVAALASGLREELRNTGGP